MANNIIPKIIHCVWLSGDEKPPLIQECLSSWKKIMPDYEIHEWGMKDVAHINSSFLKGAIKARKWAFATDFLRVYLLYHYGGIYMDLDVYVYRSLDPFLSHRAFSGIEFWPVMFYKSFRKSNVQGIGIDAAIMGAEKGHSWIKDILSFYNDKDFVNTSDFYMQFIMPNVIANISHLNYGFKYIPVFQVLNDDVYLYPPDVFSACCNRNLFGETSQNYYLELGNLNQMRYTCHLCSNSWGYVVKTTRWQKIKFQIKKIVLQLLGKSFVNLLKIFFNYKN